LATTSQSLAALPHVSMKEESGKFEYIYKNIAE
jgi:hypothetical protein